ncbi:MAG: type II secretion system protein [Planctomycetes bacterium]|nr:type II secretion system protein [Planctomycetota bacterium]
MRKTHRRGFSLVELMVVVAIMAVLISFAVPRFLGARRSANETSAIGTMRAIVSAQMALQAAGSIDTDSDGQAEYGYFGEMGGTVPARVSAGGSPGAGTLGNDELDPSPLIQSLGSVSQSVVTHSGYVFQIWLPAGNAAPIAGLAEDPSGGKLAAPFPDSDATENAFCAYGWPVRAGFTGSRCFFVNQEGVILEMQNRGATPYSGVTGGPDFDAAFGLVGDMSAGFARGGPAADGNTWMPVQ